MLIAWLSATFSQTIGVKDINNLPIAVTSEIHQGFFDNFKFILSGLFIQLLQNFTLPEENIGPLGPASLPLIGELYFFIDNFKIVKLNLNSSSTDFNITENLVALSSRGIRSEVRSDFRILYGLRQSNTSIERDISKRLNKSNRFG